MAETKQCEVCEQEIGSNETKCPKCSTVFAELEEDLTNFERIAKVAEARKKAKEPPVVEPPAKPARRSLFHNLGVK